MSQDLSSVRMALARVSSDLKQNRLLPAAKAVQGAVKALVHVPMLKHEQEELSRMLGEACVLLQNSRELRQVFPLAIAYTPKKEAALAATMDELIPILEGEAADQAQSGMEALLARQRQTFEKGKSELEAGDHAAARETFSVLTGEFSEDAALMTHVGEAFLQKGLYADATHYLSGASLLLPDSAHVLNHLGIALRKLGRLDVAEEKFRAALALEDKDPNLYFNLGRLYLDAQKWQSCLECAQAALALDPSLGQASKMSAYCRRMLDNGKS
ncbi:MAG: tetratricopeptide repeat protein [Deltaproteobacteria bacterium]|jgi:tetratricopeptide (TPR) repeat protein|nr:tetratricopeptide repeat protein [Deltaproteobacteria bacterium]